MSICFNNTYAELNDKFYTRIFPTPVSNPNLIYFNTDLAASLRVCHNESESILEKAAIFSGNQLPPSADPIALVYAGHQFGHFVSQLGDGRAILLGEVIDIKGSRWDMQLKGSGTTPYSRGGDGRAALGPIMRECIMSEAMHALGIKTTRTLAAVITGDYVLRNGHLLPGAILTRIAASHIRIGTFQYFSFQLDYASLKILADYTINRHYPEANNHSNPYIALFKKVTSSLTDLIIEWMRIGFIHGVMNTDNMAISGQTLDYGPCAFMDDYDPNKVFSSIDYKGRYRFSHQATICYWNLLQFAQTLAPLIKSNTEEAMDLLSNLLFISKARFNEKYISMMCRKIGFSRVKKGDDYLVKELLNIMHKDKSDYTLTFRYLSNYIVNLHFEDITFNLSHNFKLWMTRWQERLKKEEKSLENIHLDMLKENPAVIPRNHLIEECITQALNKNDFSNMYSMMSALKKPYDASNEKLNLYYMKTPQSHEHVYQTFCGT